MYVCTGTILYMPRLDELALAYPGNVLIIVFISKGLYDDKP